MQGTHALSSGRSHCSRLVALSATVLLGVSSAVSTTAHSSTMAVGAFAQANHADADDYTITQLGTPVAARSADSEDRDYLITEIFQLQAVSDVVGFRAGPAYDADSLTLTAIGYQGDAADVEELGQATLFNIRRYPSRQGSSVAGSDAGSTGASERQYEITRMTGELVGSGGTTYVYGIEISSTFDVDGETRQVTVFEVFSVADSRSELDGRAAAHTDALSGLDTQSVPGRPALLFGEPPACSTCGDTWNNDINTCDFIGDLCVAAQVTAHVIAAAACPATTPILLTACIAAVEISLTLNLAQCAYSLNDCFIEANEDYDNCNRTCDGGPGQIP